MSETGPHTSDRELLADIKQDESNVYNSSEPQATKSHIAGAEGKLSSALSQAQGDSDINTGGKQLSRDVPPSGREVNRDDIQASLHARADQRIEEQTGGEPFNLKKGSEASRLQSAAEQYGLAREGKKAPPQ